MSFLEKRLFRSFAQFLTGLFVFLVLSHIMSLNVLEIKPLSEVPLANMFYHIVSYFFILIMVSLAVQKLFSLIWSHSFIFSFISLALRDIVAKILLRGYLKFSSLFFPLGVLWCHDLYLSFIHFEIILVYGVSWWSSFIFLHVPVQPINK